MNSLNFDGQAALTLEVPSLGFSDKTSTMHEAKMVEEAPMLEAQTCLLSVVIPVYNEQATFLKVLEKVRAVPLHKEIIVVDDGSTDGTRELLQKQVDGQMPDVRVFYQPHNQGKGAALRRGFVEATGDLVIVQDADLEYNPAEYPQLIAPLLAGEADVVYGSRFYDGSHHTSSFIHSLANRCLTVFSNLCTGFRLTDMETCYKVFRRQDIQSLSLKQNRFGFEPEVTAKIGRRGLKIKEVPVSYSWRTGAEGKKIGWKDGFEALWCIVRYTLRD